MASPAHSNGRDQNHSPFSPIIPRLSPTISLPSSPSFSSSNPSFSLKENIAINSPFSTRTPLHFPGHIPFSWEQISGIPKYKQLSEEKNDAPQLHISLLPLPPAAIIPNQKQTGQNKHSTSTHASFRKVPFFAVLVESSKGSDQHGSISNFSKISRAARTLTDRLGFMSMHTNISCKNTCAVSESMVYLPRSSHDIYSINTRHPR